MSHLRKTRQCVFKPWASVGLDISLIFSGHLTVFSGGLLVLRRYGRELHNYDEVAGHPIESATTGPTIPSGDGINVFAPAGLVTGSVAGVWWRGCAGYPGNGFGDADGRRGHA